MFDMYFYAEVSTDTSAQVIQQVREFKALDPTQPINVHIQSHGGSVTAGLHLCDFFQEAGNIHTHVEGMAASAASLIAVCGKQRSMTPHSFMLLHQPSLRLERDANTKDLMDESYNLNLILQEMIQIYVSNSKMTEEQVAEIITDERYLTAQECLEFGLVDKVES